MAARFIFVVAGLLIVVGAAFIARRVLRGVVPQGDPRLEQLQALNPHLSFTDEFARVPIYWIVHPDGRRIMLPIDEMEGMRITLVDCATASIPSELQYPQRTELTCLELANETHKLHAYFFESKDNLEKAIAFYEALLPPVRRFGTRHGGWEERKETTESPDGERKLLYRLYLREVTGVKGFVVYREEATQK